jgi:hypothetical protein
MTIEELVNQLAMFDPETRVFVDGFEFGLEDPNVRKARVALDVDHTIGHAGEHADADDEDWRLADAAGKGHKPEIVEGVVLARRRE